MQELPPIRRALVSVSDKSNLSVLAETLIESRVEVLSTGGLMTQSMQGYLMLARGNAGSPEELAEVIPRITELAEKDLAHSVAAGREFGIELPGSELCQQLMARVYGLEGADQ